MRCVTVLALQSCLVAHHVVLERCFCNYQIKEQTLLKACCTLEQRNVFVRSTTLAGFVFNIPLSELDLNPLTFVYSSASDQYFKLQRTLGNYYNRLCFFAFQNNLYLSFKNVLRTLLKGSVLFEIFLLSFLNSSTLLQMAVNIPYNLLHAHICRNVGRYLLSYFTNLDRETRIYCLYYILTKNKQTFNKNDVLLTVAVN